MKFLQYIKEGNEKSYENFKKILSNFLYKTTGKLLDYIHTNHITYKNMFEKLSKKEAQKVLDLAKKHEEFHQDNIKFYQKIIDKK